MTKAAPPEALLDELGDILAINCADILQGSDAGCEPIDDNARAFARFLRAERINRGLSREALAEKAEIREADVLALENSLILSTKIRPVLLHSLAAALTIDIETFEFMLERKIPAPGIAGAPAMLKNAETDAYSFFGSNKIFILAVMTLLASLVSSIGFLFTIWNVSEKPTISVLYFENYVSTTGGLAPPLPDFIFQQTSIVLFATLILLSVWLLIYYEKLKLPNQTPFRQQIQIAMLMLTPIIILSFMLVSRNKIRDSNDLISVNATLYPYLIASGDERLAQPGEIEYKWDFVEKQNITAARSTATTPLIIPTQINTSNSNPLIEPNITFNNRIVVTLWSQDGTRLTSQSIPNVYHLKMNQHLLDGTWWALRIPRIDIFDQNAYTRSSYHIWTETEIYEYLEYPYSDNAVLYFTTFNVARSLEGSIVYGDMVFLENITFIDKENNDIDHSPDTSTSENIANSEPDTQRRTSIKPAHLETQMLAEELASNRGSSHSGITGLASREILPRYLGNMKGKDEIGLEASGFFLAESTTSLNAFNSIEKENRLEGLFFHLLTTANIIHKEINSYPVFGLPACSFYDECHLHTETIRMQFANLVEAITDKRVLYTNSARGYAIAQNGLLIILFIVMGSIILREGRILYAFRKSKRKS